ncbi:MAG: acyl-CoA dehydrogenase, partial [Deltaproteobacteria bacterium]|nr:acyl-CoA dehydrogenase [Deltaproteobacteria bacterium]
RHTADFNEGNHHGSLPPAGAVEGLSAEAAFKVASEAIQICGGNGLSKEYCIEKIFRDARASMIEDGTNEALALIGAVFL